ncbi:phage antirepressor KilAC domain-containing protein [Rhodococcus sp. T2V]|uniref:phage antirepressor KilAC domain-containing protein n=1 Tax=Rhodococcus sp. T2V TaxID=3034164 RepID=UPI0023E0B736|nr:phage antirepressor KilAC domain-containing protein [Rhodococcus sp. T2V]MDF3308765.1 phage antirepressor KilAC domain-containing protein [Rhodococcus sp. T2V]
MSEIQTTAASPSFDDGRRIRPDGSEFWSARRLAQQTEYETWRNFAAAIERAKVAAANSGADPAREFVQVAKVVDAGNLGSQSREDYELSRFGAYLTVMNGDPRKPAIAAAQAYFAIRTREAEAAAPALTGPELMARALLEAASTLKEKDAQIAALEPKANYVDVFVTENDLLSVRTVASTLDVQESWLRAELVARKWIYAEHSTRWSQKRQCKVPQTRYSEYSDKKAYFQRVENHDAPRFRGEVMHTLKVTAVGANAISRMVPRWNVGDAA